MKYKYILFSIILFASCTKKRDINTSFYYWKTVYKKDSVESAYLNQLNCKQLYVRIMDVDLRRTYIEEPIPIAPISFADSLPDSVKIVPVVFIVNEVLKNQNSAQLRKLAENISAFVKAKVAQSGKSDFNELQIDCDWTASTKNNYFSLLHNLREFNTGKILSSTLRLHQLKSQIKMGIPPVDRVLLMCYNMGNLRRFGAQNSILDLEELKKYAGNNLSNYPKEIDLALPLFSWLVVFRNQEYAGISRRVKPEDLQNLLMFDRQENGLFVAKLDLPAFGIRKDDVVRYEDSKPEDVEELATYLSSHLPNKPVNVLYYHLDKSLFKNYTVDELEKISHLLH